MARQTFHIVRSIIAYQVLVRIVAGGARDPRIGPAETFAVRQPVRLKANIYNPARVVPNHSFPTAMALSAEV